MVAGPSASALAQVAVVLGCFNRESVRGAEGGVIARLSDAEAIRDIATLLCVLGKRETAKQESAGEQSKNGK